MKTLTNRLLLLVTLGALALGACNVGSLGASGEFRFTDETPELEYDFNRAIDRPLATGAVMEIKVRKVDGSEAIVAASSSDTSVLEVVEHGDDWVKVRGLAAGTSTLTVRGTDVTEDSIALEVRDIDNTALEFVPWDPLIHLDPVLWADGVAMLTGATTRVFPLHRDATGQTLTGYGAVDCEAVGTGAAVRDENSDFVAVTAGDAPGALTVTCNATSAEIEIIEEEQVASVALFSQTDSLGPATPDIPLELESGRNYLMHVPAYTAENKYVIGAGAEPILVTAPEGAVVQVSLDPVSAAAEAEAAMEGSEEEDAGQDEADLARILANGRALVIDANGVGDTTLSVSWAGRTAEIPVTVR